MVSQKSAVHECVRACALLVQRTSRCMISLRVPILHLKENAFFFVFPHQTAWSFCSCGLRKGPPNPARRFSHGRVESSVTDLPLSGVSTACIPATFDLKGDVGLGTKFSRTGVGHFLVPRMNGVRVIFIFINRSKKNTGSLL